MKKTPFSRILALLLCMAMLLTVTGCGQTDDAQSTTTPAQAADPSESVTPATEGAEAGWDGYRMFETPETITVAGCNNASYVCDWNTIEETQKIEEVFGIKFDATNYTWEQWTTQLNLMLNMDELPDLLVNASMGNNADLYGADGYLLNMMDYIDYMPNIQKLWEEYPNLKPMMLSADGGLYSLGTLNLNPYATANVPTVMINNEWLERVGMEVPTTTDELLEVLRAFRDQDANGNGDPNDEIPLGAADDWSATYLRRVLMAAFGMKGRGMGKDDNVNFNFYADDNGTVGLYETSENYKAYLKYWNTLYEEGLLDPEFFTMSTDQYKEKLDTYGTYGVVSYGPRNEGGQSYDFTALVGLTSELNDVKYAYQDVNYSKGAVAISANTEHPEELCHFLDYFYGSEQKDEFYNGVRYGYAPANVSGYEEYSGQDIGPLLEKWGVERADAWKHITTYVIIQNAFSTYLTENTTFWRDFNHDQLVKLYEDSLVQREADSSFVPDQNIQPAIAYSREDLEYFAPYPKMTYTTDEIDARTAIMTDLCSYMNSECAQFILGNKDIDENFDAFVAELYEMGLEDLLEIEQAAYDRNN